MDNYKVMEHINAMCHPSRANTLTGANYDTSWYPYHSAEPCTLTHTPLGVEGTGEFLPQGTPLPFEEYAVDWPVGVMAVRHSVLQS